MAGTKHVLMVLGSYDQSAHEGIALYAGQNGWHLNVSILKDFQLPDHWQGDGIITSLNNSRQLEEFVLGAKVPTVDLSIWREDIDLPRVAADNTEIGRVGAEHFIEMGHRNCAWFGLATNPVSRTRYKAFADRLAEAGVDCVRLDTVKPQDPVYMTQRILDLPKPCAIYTKSDYDSAWILNLCLDAGLSVPEEVAILGADDNPLICDSQVVPLSSVRHDLKRIGYEGAAMLDSLMRGEVLNERLKLIQPKGITVRKSTDVLAVTDTLIRDVILYLKENYRRSMGTKEVADLFKISRRMLEIRFRAQMHCSLREFLIGVRIGEAKKLLNFTKDTTETIAAMTGFCHAAHFSNTFKKVVGMSPIQYRKTV